MTPKTEPEAVTNPAEQDLVLSQLEREQLAGVKQRFPRRRMRGREVFLLWALRVYVLLMAVVVLYQILHA